MKDVEVVIRIPKETYDYVKKQVAEGIDNPLKVYIANGTPLSDIEKMLSSLDLSMSYVLESDHRSFANPVTGNGWLFDKIIDWRKTIRPYIKKEG